MTTPSLDPSGRWRGTPVYALLSLMLFVITAAILTLKGHMSDDVLTVIVMSTVPSLVASLFAERASRDIRNGVLRNKVREGTHQALQESGVAEVAANALSTTPVIADAMARLVDSLDQHNLRVTAPAPEQNGGTDHG